MGYNDFSTRAQTVNAAVLDYLRNYAGLSRVIRKDFAAELVPSGSVINLAFAPNLTAVNFASSPSGTNATVANPTRVQVSLDHYQHAPFVIDDLSQFGNQDLITQYVRSAMEAVMTAVELDCYQKIASGSDNNTNFVQITSSSVGPTKGSGLSHLTGSLQLLMAARNNLNSSKVPLDGRVFLTGVTEMGNFLSNTQLQKINETDEPSIVRNGMFGFQKLGFWTSETQFQASSTPSGTINVALHPDAAVLVARQPLIAKSNQRVALINDPVSGFPFAYAEWDQEGQTKYSIVALWAVKVLRDRHAVVLYG